ncbi:type I secretion system permease/ATPase [Facilibium subflavum]|uniref:type I secretion system permease/ATPase n=1 Tax=Facilibium subflavum TaxID=2219058 RepID=UPI000E656532|nr:type I secretion system permease/ATPase [Facilibium subflavum]
MLSGCDSGIFSFVKIASLYHIAINEQMVYHEYGNGTEPLSQQALLRAIKSYHFKVKHVKTTAQKINFSLLPAIALGVDGYFVVLGVKKQQNEYLVIDPLSRQIKHLTEDAFNALFANEIIYLTPKHHSKKQQQFSIRWFIPALWKYRHIFRDVLIASFFLQLFALVTPLFFQVVMDKVVVHQALTTLEILAIGFLVVSLFEVIFGAIRTYLLSHTTSRVDVELGSRLYKHLLSLPLAYFESRQIGQNVARVKELDSMREFLTSSALILIIDLGFTFVFFSVMWFYSPTLTLVVLLTIPFYAGLSIFIAPILRYRLDKAFKEGAKNQAFLTESLTGIQTIKSSAIEPRMQHKWEENLASYVQTNFRARNLSNISGQIAQFISKITTLLIIFIGVKSVINGQLTIGQLIAFNMLAGRVTTPILKFVQLWQDFQQASISLQRLGDVLNALPETSQKIAKHNLDTFQGEVCFKAVNFRYHSDMPLCLKQVSFDSKPGQMIGIVGRSGSGKSTLTKLIQRLYVPESGRILIDGVDLSAIDISWLRQNIGVVLQENFLFNCSVRDNIALTCPGASLHNVIHVAKLSGAHEFICTLNNGYETLIKEQGANFSGGQKQRLAIARALIHDPRILIFDEATSALDYESERIIQANMQFIAENRTVFIIAHRLSSVTCCDQIMYLKDGVITEVGTHQDLLQRQGDYASLYKAQYHTQEAFKKGERIDSNFVNG